jgi:hypothetical protein
VRQFRRDGRGRDTVHHHHPAPNERARSPKG